MTDEELIEAMCDAAKMSRGYGVHRDEDLRNMKAALSVAKPEIEQRFAKRMARDMPRGPSTWMVRWLAERGISLEDGK